MAAAVVAVEAAETPLAAAGPVWLALAAMLSRQPWEPLAPMAALPAQQQPWEPRIQASAALAAAGRMQPSATTAGSRPLAEPAADRVAAGIPRPPMWRAAMAVQPPVILSSAVVARLLLQALPVQPANLARWANAALAEVVAVQARR
jgi:hypothetical protein